MMLNRCFITVVTAEGLHQLKQSPSPLVACTLLIDGGKPEAAGQLLSSSFTRKPGLPLTLALVNALPGNETAASLAALFLAHPSYLKSGEGTCLFVSGEESRAAWTAWLLAQGYRKPLVRVFDPAIFSQCEPRCIRLGEDGPPETAVDFNSFYHLYLNTRFRAADAFLLHDPANPALVQSRLEETLARFAAESPYLFQLCKEMAATRQKLRDLEKTADETAEELAIMKELLRMSKESRDAAYILDFYKKEYEVLPLWYKRFGHIIKAIMGKRSWLSLIRDHG